MGGAAYEFLHKSFQEYLTAERIWKCFLDLGAANGEGEYYRDDANQVLQSLYSVLSPKPISLEIRGYILEMAGELRNSDQSQLLRVYERMVYFTPRLIEAQFMLKFDGTVEKGPLFKMANVAYVYTMLLFEMQSVLSVEGPRLEFPVIPGVVLGMTALGHPLPLYLRGGGACSNGREQTGWE